MANTRILENHSGHDRTGTTTWKWYQVRECLTDPCVSISVSSNSIGADITLVLPFWRKRFPFIGP